MRLKRERVPAYRGNIYDRNNELLAYTRVKRFVDIGETFKGLYGNTREALIMEISDLTGFSNLEISESISSGQDIPIRPDISVSNPSIEIVYHFNRVYNFNGSISHVIGYLNEGFQGVAGVEKTYNNSLNGTEGIKQTEIDAKTRQLKYNWLRKPEKGKNLHLSIDVHLQNYIEGLLKEFDNPSIALVSDPGTGEILSMVSLPSYESSIMTQSMTDEKWQTILGDERKPFLNRTIASAYNPGSLIKPFMALSSLAENEREVHTKITDRLFCEGFLEIESNMGTDPYRYKDWKETGHGTMTLFSAIKESCNVYFYHLGMDLGIDWLKEISDQIGLAGQSGIELPGEIDGIYPSVDWKKDRLGERWYLGDTILTSIGQGYLQLTPVELLKLFELVAQEGEKNRSTIISNPFTLPGQYIKLEKGNWTYLKYAMNAVVHQPGGTAYSAFYDADYSDNLAGKTGTAETQKEGVYNAMFGGFYPLKNPEYCVIVLLEGAGYGGQNAAPVARKIFDYLLLNDAITQ